MKNQYSSRLATRLASLLAACALAGCAASANMPPTRYGRSDYAPASPTVAQLPSSVGGGEAYQDSSGPAYLVGAAAGRIDAGGESLPQFPAGAEPPITDTAGSVVMPNGSGRSVRSLNSVSNPP